MDKPYGYDECCKAIKDAMLKEPARYEAFTEYFDTGRLEEIKAHFGKYLFDLCKKDVELRELPISESDNPIKVLRERTELSRQEFADYFEIPAYTIRNWEQGTRTPPDYVVRLLERVIKAEEQLAAGIKKDEI